MYVRHWWRNAAEEDAQTSSPDDRSKSFAPSSHAGFLDEPQTYFKFRKNFGRPKCTINSPYFEPPPKAPTEYKWLRTQYMPEWTDPEWQDPALSRAEVVAGKWRPARNLDLGRTLRPAQLPKDAALNPTPYAKRFGMYPGRTDGRSRLSPAREVPKKLPGAQNEDQAAPQGNAADILEEFKQLAKSSNRDPHEFLEELKQPENFGSLNDNDQFMVQTVSDIYDDLDWQAILFNGLTTDEVCITPSITPPYCLLTPKSNSRRLAVL